MAVELGKRKDSKGLDSSGLPIPPSVAIDLSACQVLASATRETASNIHAQRTRDAG